jgi:sec-independent protein translocase protein TatB
MIDFSFSEIMVVLVVAILFIKPQNIPEISKRLGQFFSKLKNLFNDVKEEVFREEKFKDLKKIQRELKKTNDKK